MGFIGFVITIIVYGEWRIIDSFKNRIYNLIISILKYVSNGENCSNEEMKRITVEKNLHWVYEHPNFNSIKM